MNDVRNGGAVTLITAVAVLVAGAAACGHGRLLPASTAHVVPGAPESAVAEQDGVRVAADADDWRGKPVDLATRLTPVKVRIVNHSGKPIRILYERFALAGAHGRVYRPLPPTMLAEAAGVSHGEAVQPIFASESFFVGPRLHDVYPSLTPWPRPLPRTESFYDRQWRRWKQDLPTTEMRRMGLPEGVLADDGQISGFLYFENATDRERRVVFKADLDDDDDGSEVTSIEIPFQVE
jgi:hypothetical protein